MNGQFILTGSQNFHTSDQIAQSLASRTAIIRLLPFSLNELRGGLPHIPTGIDTYLFRGMCPRVWDQNLDPTFPVLPMRQESVTRPSVSG